MSEYKFLTRSIDELAKHLKDLNENEQINSILLLVSNEFEKNVDKLDIVIRKSNKPLAGGVFPAIIFDGKVYEDGAIIIGQSFNMKTHIADLTQLDTFFDELDSNIISSENYTVFSCIDAFGENKSAYIEYLFDTFGYNCTYFGGGAGSLDFLSKKSIFNETGIYKNSAVIAILENNKTNIQIAHGWEEISEPLKVTEIDGNNIVSLNWRPAFDVYSEIICEKFKENIDKNSFFNVAKSYPFGILRKDADFVVRDPISTDGNKIQIVDYVPKDEYVFILTGTKEKLIQAASNLTPSESTSTKGDGISLIIDCISRYLFLGGDFSSELEKLDPFSSSCGILSIGEIANNGSSYLEIYNKTTVLVNYK